MFRSRLAALAPLSLAALSLAISAPVHAQQQGDPTLNAQNADIRAFIQDVSRVTGRTFVIDPVVQGQVTIASGGALTEDQMYEVFLSTSEPSSAARACATSSSTISVVACSFFTMPTL